MKIVILGPAHPLRGGIAATNESLALALQEAGHEVTVVSFSLQYPGFLFPGKSQFTDDPAPEGLHIHPLVNSINPFSWWKAARFINQIQPELLIVRFWLPFMGPSLGTVCRLVKNSVRKIAITDNVIPHEHRPGDRALTRYFLKSCQGFVTLSRSVQEDIRQFTSKPTRFLFHPLNDQYGEPGTKAAARNQLGWDPDQKIVLFFGLVRAYKGLDLLLQAFGDQRMKESDIHLVVAGEFYDDPEKYQVLIEEHNLHNSVTLINAFISNEDVQHYFNAADLLAQTYHTATQSGITQIAYQFNLPMVVTDVGGLAEMVPDTQAGYVVPKDPEAIANAVYTYFDQGESDRMRSFIEGHKNEFAWSTFVERLIAFAQNPSS